MIDSVAQLLDDGQVTAHSVQPVHTETCGGTRGEGVWVILVSRNLQEPFHQHLQLFSTWSMHIFTKAGTVALSL